MIKQSSKKKVAKKKVKTVFCSGCFGIFIPGVCIQAPQNKWGLRIVCPSCYKEYFGAKSSPMPMNTTHLANKYGVYVNENTIGILSNANAGILSNANAGVIARDGAGLIGNGSGTLVGNGSGTFRKG